MRTTTLLQPRRRGRTRGQSLTEFALTLPVLMLTLVMTLDFGRVFLGWVELNNAARIAANYAAQHPDAWSDLVGVASERAKYQDLIRNDAAGLNCTLPSPAPTPNFPDGTGLGGRAQVNLTCSFSLITPIVGNIVGNPLPVGATAVFPIRSGEVNGIPVGPATPTASPTPSPSPTPSASASPSPSPSPSPTPSTCRVPQFNGSRSAVAQQTWTAAGFTTIVVFSPVRPPEYTINDQSLVQNTMVACNSAITLYDRNQHR